MFSRSFFASPADLSAAELATMFHIYFLGSSEGLIFDVANDNFDTALWKPLQQYLTERGVRFHLGSAVSSIERGAGTRHSACTPMPTKAWTPTPSCWPPTSTGLQRIVASSPGLGDDMWRARIKKLRTAPPFMVHRLWLDRPVAADRAAFLGTAGHEPLDNISILDRYERQAADWAREHGGSVVELHSYAVQSAQPQTAMLSRLHELYPETADARVVHEQMLYHRDCPLFAPGSHAQRPGVTTPLPGLLLAGDGVRIDLPVALMERAATTGWTAANQILDAMGTRRSYAVYGSDPRPFGAAALPCRSGKAFATMSIGDNVRRRWPKDWPLQAIPPVSWAEQRPTYRDASPAIIDAALARSQRKPTGNWYAFAASRDVRSGRPSGIRVAGVELVAWRDRESRLRVGPRSCPHLGADLATAAVQDGALICRWHGLCLDADTDEFGWRTLPSHDDGVLAWVRLDSVGGETPPTSR